MDFGDAVLALAELLDLDRDGVRQLLREAQHQLLADHFRRQKAFAAIGKLVFAELRLANGQARNDLAFECVDAVALLRRDQAHRGVETIAGDLLQKGQQLLLVLLRIDLVDRKQARTTAIGQYFAYELIFVSPAPGFDQLHTHIGLRDRTARSAVELAIDRACAACMQARRIEQQDLPGLACDDAEYAVPRGLRLRPDDGEARTDQRVDQRGLADVRAAHDRDGAAAEFCSWCDGFAHAFDDSLCHCASTSVAAACSAMRRLLARPCPRMLPPGRLHSTSNTLA